MKHLTEEQFMDHIYREAPESELAAIDRHASSCRACRARAEELKISLAAIDRTADGAAPPRLAEKLAAIYSGETRESRGAGAESAPAPRENDRAAGGIMTPEELAEFLRIPEDSIYEMLHELPYLNIAGRVRFRRSSIEKWLEAREKNPVRGASKRPDLDAAPVFWQNVV